MVSPSLFALIPAPNGAGEDFLVRPPSAMALAQKNGGETCFFRPFRNRVGFPIQSQRVLRFGTALSLPWSVKRLRLTPTGFDTVSDYVFRPAFTFAPSLKRQCLALMRDESVASGIARLLFSSGPSKVARNVAFRVVNSIQAMVIRRPVTNVINQIKNGIFTAVSVINANSAAPIMFVRRMLRVVATCFCPPQSLSFSGSTHTLFSSPSVINAGMAARVCSLQIAPLNFGRVSTVTSAQPNSTRICGSDVLKHSQVSISFICFVFDSPHLRQYTLTGHRSTRHETVRH